MTFRNSHQCVSQVQARLRSESWDSRTAAGECLGRIAAHCQHHCAADLAAAARGAAASQKQPEQEQLDAKPDAALLSFQGFSIAQVLERGTLLLASGGQVCACAHVPIPGALCPLLRYCRPVSQLVCSLLVSR